MGKILNTKSSISYLEFSLRSVSGGRLPPPYGGREALGIPSAGTGGSPPPIYIRGEGRDLEFRLSAPREKRKKK